MSGARPSLSIVIPVYNGAASLDALVERLEPVLRRVASEFELVLVDDDSRDESWARICELGHEHAWIRGQRLSRNYGQHNALLAGVRTARGDRIVTLDDDLQHPPEEIPTLLARLDEHCDVVYGTPQRMQHGWLRNLASWATKLALSSAMGAEIARQVSPFRAFRTRLRDAFAGYASPDVSLDVLLTWGTTRFAAVRVRHEERAFGRSNYGFRRLLRHALNMLTGFSVLPLQLASLVGFVFTLLGGGLLAYVLGRFLLEGNPVPGFPFLASVVTLFSGAQLFALGIIGEYLARIYFRSMGRPSYTVRDHTGRDRGTS